jgi:hypothetical protein
MSYVLRVWTGERTLSIPVHTPLEHSLPAAHDEHAVHAAEVVKPVAEKKLDAHVHWVEPGAATLLLGHDEHEAAPAVVENVLTVHAVSHTATASETGGGSGNSCNS